MVDKATGSNVAIASWIQDSVAGFRCVQFGVGRIHVSPTFVLNLMVGCLLSHLPHRHSIWGVLSPGCSGQTASCCEGRTCCGAGRWDPEGPQHQIWLLSSTGTCQLHSCMTEILVVLLHAYCNYHRTFFQMRTPMGVDRFSWLRRCPDCRKCYTHSHVFVIWIQLGLKNTVHIDKMPALEMCLQREVLLYMYSTHLLSSYLFPSFLWFLSLSSIRPCPALFSPRLSLQSPWRVSKSDS